MQVTFERRHGARIIDRQVEERDWEIGALEPLREHRIHDEELGLVIVETWRLRRVWTADPTGMAISGALYVCDDAAVRIESLDDAGPGV